MRIEFFENGFTQHLNHKHVEKILCKYDEGCTVYYYNEPPKFLAVECEVYNRRLGFPVSEDGTMLFTTSWENGLTAYRIADGSIVWRYKRTRMKNIFTYPSYVIASRYGKSIIKYDLNTGEILGEINSGTIEDVWKLTSPYILVEMIRGKLSVVNTETMTVVKVYKQDVINPNHCLAQIILGYQLKDNVLSIYGSEEYPNYDDTIVGDISYNRVIDSDFLAGL